MSSSSFFSKFKSPDVLLKTRLKPWYETVRAYLVFTNIAVSIYMVYDTKSDNLLDCVSANASAEFSTSTTTYVNSYCAAHLLGWHQRNFGIVCLLSSVFIYLSFGWWLLIPSVTKSFLLIRQCDDELRTLERGPSYLKSILQKHYSNKLPVEESSKAETSKLIVTTQRLWFEHSGDISIFIIYAIRNAMGFLISAGAVALLTYLAPNNIGNAMHCQLDILNGARAHCLAHTKDKLWPFVITTIVATSTICIWSLGLLLGFDRNKYNKLYRQLLKMCNSNREGDRLVPPENRKSDWKTAWDSAQLDTLDLERIEHGEDSNRFVELFSQSADPISINTRILMSFYSVFTPKDIPICPDRFSLLSPKTKMKKWRRQKGLPRDNMGAADEMGADGCCRRPKQ